MARNESYSTVLHRLSLSTRSGWTAIADAQIATGRWQPRGPGRHRRDSTWSSTVHVLRWSPELRTQGGGGTTGSQPEEHGGGRCPALARLLRLAAFLLWEPLVSVRCVAAVVSTGQRCRRRARPGRWWCSVHDTRSRVLGPVRPRPPGHAPAGCVAAAADARRMYLAWRAHAAELRRRDPPDCRDATEAVARGIHQAWADYVAEARWTADLWRVEWCAKCREQLRAPLSAAQAQTRLEQAAHAHRAAVSRWAQPAATGRVYLLTWLGGVVWTYVGQTRRTVRERNRTRAADSWPSRLTRAYGAPTITEVACAVEHLAAAERAAISVACRRSGAHVVTNRAAANPLHGLLRTYASPEALARVAAERALT